MTMNSIPSRFNDFAASNGETSRDEAGSAAIQAHQKMLDEVSSNPKISSKSKPKSQEPTASTALTGWANVGSDLGQGMVKEFTSGKFLWDAAVGAGLAVGALVLPEVALVGGIGFAAYRFSSTKRTISEPFPNVL